MKRKSSLSARVVKSIGMFGSVQAVTMLCGVVRAKLAAVWLGPAGMGLLGLLMSALEMVTQLTQFNLRQSSVRDIAALHDAPDSRGRIIAAVRRWAWLLGLAGMAVMLAAAPALSRWSYGDGSHTWAFVIVSAAVLLQALCESELAILQGLGALKPLARATAMGAVGGLVLTVPMYRYWGVDGVAPSIVAYVACTLVVLLWIRFRNRDRRDGVRLCWRDTWSTGRQFLRLGLYMTLASAIGTVVNYAFMSWLTYRGGADVTGVYQGGYTILNRYVGVLFAALFMEYYPRVSATISRRRFTSVIVSHELSVLMWIMLPVAPAFLAAQNIIIELLYTREFLTMAPYLSWGMTGIVLRLVSYTFMYVVIARGDGRIYIIVEALSGVVGLMFSIVGYELWGLAGIGAAYALWLGYDAVVAVAIYHYRYGLKLGRGVCMLVLVTVTISAACSAAAISGLWWLPAVIAVATVVPAARRIMRR
ncbi:MAG: oligosaccharide flippase family protein [Muribaculaceae bacterium]|nr:oligosaccharide flippase family protein [Muribaculaceae bacterium]